MSGCSGGYSKALETTLMKSKRVFIEVELMCTVVRLQVQDMYALLLQQPSHSWHAIRLVQKVMSACGGPIVWPCWRQVP